MPGEAGAEGEQAVQGPDVEAGAEDEAGADGIQGMPGEAGTEGEQAVQGPDVEAGADGIHGMLGEAGDDGEQAAQGPNVEGAAEGEAGADGVDNVQGPERDQGDTGDQGSQGEVGDVGAQRPTFAKVEMGDDENAGEPGELIVSNEARKQGDKGDLGETGAEGQKGETRPQGEEGPVGQEGMPGEAGDDGEPAAQGPDVQTGAEGEAGIDGVEVARDPPEMSTSEGELTAKEDNVTPAVEAVEDGNLQKLKELLDQQEDVIELVVGEKLLFKAAECGHLEIMEFLLNNFGVDLAIEHSVLLDRPLDLAIEQNDSAMVKLLIEYGANIKSVSSNMSQTYILLEDTIRSIEILIDRVYAKMKKEIQIDHDALEQIMILIQLEADCSEDVNIEKLSTEHCKKLKELCSLENVREYNHYAVIVNLMEIANIENNKNESGGCCSKIKEWVDNKAKSCYTNTIGRCMKSHIDSCKMISWLMVIFSLFFIGILHIGDIFWDFKIGLEDSRKLDDRTRTLGILEISIVFFCLYMENCSSARSLFNLEAHRLSLVKKKSRLDLVQSDWDSSTLNFYSGTKVYQILLLAHWPFKNRDQDGEILKKSILFNILSLFQLRPVVDHLRLIFHDSSPRHWINIIEAKTMVSKQAYVVYEQIPEFLIQVYTLHMVLSSDDENITGRLISLTIPILTIPYAIISLEECLRKIDPSITELGNSKYILFLSHILAIPGRFFLLSSVMFLSDKPYVIGYIILRIVVEVILNIFSPRQLISLREPLINFERTIWRWIIPKSLLFGIKKFLIRVGPPVIFYSIRDVFIVSIRTPEGYILMKSLKPNGDTNKLIRSNREILLRYFVMILESIAMTLLIESFYNPEDNKKIKYQHGIWIKEAAWIVTILLVISTTIVYLIINFIHHERLLKSLKEYFKWRIAKSFIGGLIIVISLMSIKQHYFGSSIPILYYYFTGCSIYLIVLAFSIILSNSMFSEILEKCKATSLRVVGPQW